MSSGRSSKNFIIPRDEFYQLYLVDNKSLEEIKDYYKCSIDKIYRYQKIYDFHKTKEQTIECRRNTNLKKYGVTTIMNYTPIKDKYKQSNKNRKLKNIDNYVYDKSIDRIEKLCNIHITKQQLFDILHCANKKLFVKILESANRKVTFYEISNMLNCTMAVTYRLNHYYKTDSYFKWNRSYYEEYICHYLEIFNVEFVREKTFEGLTGLKGGSLRFDFYLPKFNSCVEYDGEQHYINPTYQRQVHDNLKNDYCKQHNILLYRLNQYYFKNPVLADRALELIASGRPIDYNYLERGV